MFWMDLRGALQVAVMGGGNERLRHEHSLRTAATRICDDGWLPSAKHSRGCRKELQKGVSATPWACGRRGRSGKVANIDAKIPVRANTKRCECKIIRAGHRPLASICPMVPYTLHEWTEVPYGCDIGIPLRPRQRVDETTDGCSGA